MLLTYHLSLVRWKGQPIFSAKTRQKLQKACPSVEQMPTQSQHPHSEKQAPHENLEKQQKRAEWVFTKTPKLTGNKSKTWNLFH